MHTTRTFLAALVDGGGTVPPELDVVRRLVAAGHRVTVLAEDTMREEVVATGAEFRRWTTAPNRPSRRPEDDPYRDWECRTPMQLFRRLLDTQLAGPAPAYAADTEAAIGDVRPDVVVCSMFAVGAMVAAEARGLPFAVLHANIWPLPADGRPPFGLGLRPAAGVLGRVRDRSLDRFVQRTWDRGGLAALNALRRERDLTPVAHFFDQVRDADRHLILTSADFDLPGALPPNAVYVGPVLGDPRWAEQPWEPPVGDGPLVLIGLSSTFQDQVATLQRAVDALAMLPVRGLVTTGPTIDPEQLVLPPNVSAVTAAPHHSVLQHAAAVVTHGGHGTVVKSLSSGVPLVVMPHGRDQADNAVRVELRGAGLRVARNARSRTIADAVGRVLGDGSFASNAARLGAALRRDADDDLAVRQLEGLASAAPGSMPSPTP